MIETPRAFILSNLGLLKVSGPDAKKFLQGQLTCNLEEINHTQSRLGAFCNPQGRVISFFHLFMRNEDYYLLMPSSLVPVTLAALKKYAVFFKTELTDASNQLLLIGYQNLSLNTPTLPINTTRFIWVGEQDQLPAELQTYLHEDIERWHDMNITDGIPYIYPETSGKFLPHDLNLQQLNAISFNKGCYTGQEIIARMQYRGKLKNHLYRATLTTTIAPKPGVDIYYKVDDETRTGGVIVDVSYIGNNQYRTLLITDETNAIDQHLFLTTEQQAFFTFYK